MVEVGQVSEARINWSCQSILTQVKKLEIEQGANFWRDSTHELVFGEVEVDQTLQPAYQRGNLACEPVAIQLEIQEAGEVVHRCRNGARQPVASQIKFPKLWPDVA